MDEAALQQATAERHGLVARHALVADASVDGLAADESRRDRGQGAGGPLKAGHVRPCAAL